MLWNKVYDHVDRKYWQLILPSSIELRVEGLNFKSGPDDVWIYNGLVVKNGQDEWIMGPLWGKSVRNFDSFDEAAAAVIEKVQEDLRAEESVLQESLEIVRGDLAAFQGKT